MTDHRGRTDKDFAIEFGEYLATAAENFMDSINAFDQACMQGDFLAQSVAEGDKSDGWSALRDAIYEFRKRASKAGHLPSAAKFNH